MLAERRHLSEIQGCESNDSHEHLKMNSMTCPCVALADLRNSTKAHPAPPRHQEHIPTCHLRSAQICSQQRPSKLKHFSNAFCVWGCSGNIQTSVPHVLRNTNSQPWGANPGKAPPTAHLQGSLHLEQILNELGNFRLLAALVPSRR